MHVFNLFVIILLEVFHVFLICLSFYRVLGIVHSRIVIFILTALSFFALLCGAMFLFQDAAVNMVINMLFITILVLLHNGKLLHRLGFGIFMSVLIFLSDDIALYIVSYYYSISIHIALSNTRYYLIGNVVSKVILLILLNIMTRVSKKQIGKPLPISYWVMVVFMPLSSAYLIHFVYLLSSSSTIHHIVFTTIILTINIFTFLLYDNLIGYYEMKTVNLRISLEKEQLESQIMSYNHLHHLEVKKNESIRYLKHDLTNLLAGISTSVMSGNTIEALERIDKLIGDMHTDGPAKSGNAIIDSLINFKAMSLDKLDIQLMLSLNVPYTVVLNAIDLGVIIGSIFDNAVEACNKIDADRNINLRVHYDTGMLLIHMANTFDGSLVTNSNGELLTQKKDKESHGIGIKAVQRIVDKYDGTMTYEAASNIFYLKILLCNIHCDDMIQATQTESVSTSANQ